MMTVNINPNPDFSNILWDRILEFYTDGVLFLVLKSLSKTQAEICYETVCLAAFRVNRLDNTLQLISRSLLSVDAFTVANTPDFLEYRINMTASGDNFLSYRGKVFSTVFVSEHKPCVWIHCFNRKQFFPIGKSNTAVPGLYHIGNRRVLEFELFDNRVVGMYSYELSAAKTDNYQVYRLSKLYLSF